MSPRKLSRVDAGFSDEVSGSQAVFRCALQAWSYPAQWLRLEHDACVPAGCSKGAAGLLLALLDADCALWLSPSLRNTTALDWLQFHTGCSLATSAEQAHFVWVGVEDSCPALTELGSGTDLAPQDGCTVLIDTPENAPLTDLFASGPGLKETRRVSVSGITPELLAQRRHMHARFPQGIDLYVCRNADIMGLPRTTALSASAQEEV